MGVRRSFGNPYPFSDLPRRRTEVVRAQASSVQTVFSMNFTSSVRLSEESMLLFLPVHFPEGKVKVSFQAYLESYLDDASREFFNWATQPTLFTCLAMLVNYYEMQVLCSFLSGPLLNTKNKGEEITYFLD